VSIIIPTYNRTRFLPECLDSVVAQDVDSAEIVIVDNASTDGTYELCVEYAARDARIRVMRNDRNIGQHGNLVRGLQQARGTFVKYVLSDDLLYPGAISALLQPLLSDPSIPFAMSHWVVIDAAGQRLPMTETYRLPKTDTHPLNHADATTLDGIALGDRILTDMVDYPGAPSNVLFRRDAVDARRPHRFAGFAPQYAWDVAVWLNVLHRGRVAFIPCELSAFRVHQDHWDREAASELAFWSDFWGFIRRARKMGYLRSYEDAWKARLRLLRYGLDLAKAAETWLLDEADSGRDVVIRGLARHELERRIDDLIREFRHVTASMPSSSRLRRS